MRLPPRIFGRNLVHWGWDLVQKGWAYPKTERGVRILLMEGGDRMLSQTEHSIVAQVRAARTDPAVAAGLVAQFMGVLCSGSYKFTHRAPESGPAG